jgi:hypothetical protein
LAGVVVRRLLRAGLRIGVQLVSGQLSLLSVLLRLWRDAL